MVQRRESGTDPTAGVQRGVHLWEVWSWQADSQHLRPRGEVVEKQAVWGEKENNPTDPKSVF